VISNKKDAFILERAKKHGIKTIFLDSTEIKPREFYDSKLIQIIEKEKPDLILLIGWMRILSEKFCKKFENKIINIHPSLLPDFAGGKDLNVHEEVIKTGKKITGCTLHFVTEKVDEGPIIMQKKVLIEENETPETLKEKVQKAEQEILIKAINLFEKNKIKLIDGKVLIEEKEEEKNNN
jgi:phosphoribosylglycinamide formyltransferase 1